MRSFDGRTLRVSKTVILAGGGRHALSVGTILHESGLEILGYTDVRPANLGWDYLGNDADVVTDELIDPIYVVVAIGTNTRIRERVFDHYVSSGMSFLTFKHSQSYVAGSAQVGEGCVLYPHTFVGAEVVLGKNVHVCAGAVIEHGTIIGDHSYIAPGAIIAGDVRVGTNCMIGINSTVMESVNVADYTILGAASLLLHSVELPEQTCRGVPAVCLKKS